MLIVIFDSGYYCAKTISDFRWMEGFGHVANFSKSIFAIGKVSIDPVQFHTDPHGSDLTLAASGLCASLGRILELNLVT